MRKSFIISRICLTTACFLIYVSSIGCDDQLWNSTSAPTGEALLLLLTQPKRPYHIVVNSNVPTGYTLTLRSGLQHLTISGGGTFTFPWGLADGASYNVVVSSGPFPADGTSCYSPDGTGTISSADANVSIVCMMP